MRSRLFIVSCCLLVGLLAKAGKVRELPPAGAQWTFGLVIGCNSTDDPEEVPLRYADDDSVQNARLLTQLGGPGGVILLTRLDAESKELFPQLSPAAPTKKAIGQAMRRLNQLMADHTGQKLETIELDTERDRFMNAEQSRDYGLIDEIGFGRFEKVLQKSGPPFSARNASP